MLNPLRPVMTRIFTPVGAALAHTPVTPNAITVVGTVGVAGSASYSNGTFAVTGAGLGTMITTSDGFHFVYQPLNGDGSIVARVVSVQGSSAQVIQR